MKIDYDTLKWGADAELAHKLSADSNMLPEVTVCGADPLGYKTAMANGYDTKFDRSMALMSAEKPAEPIYPEAALLGGAAAASRGLVIPAVKAVAGYGARISRALRTGSTKASNYIGGMYRGANNAFGNAAYHHPVTSNLWNGANAALSARALSSDSGIKKTAGHFYNNEYEDGALSLAGDVLDTLGFANSIYRMIGQVPWSTYYSGVRAAMNGAEKLAGLEYKKYSRIYRDSLNQARPFWERQGWWLPLRERANITNNVFRAGAGSFVNNMSRNQVMRNISMSLQTPIYRSMWSYDSPLIRKFKPVFQVGDMSNWWDFAKDGIGWMGAIERTQPQGTFSNFPYPRP